MRKYYSWKMEGKPFPRTFTDERIQRLNELGFEWRLKESNPLLDHEDHKPEAAMMDVARRVGTTIDVGSHRPTQGPAAVDDINRYEPYRTNITMYEQRGWL
jgi:hypothetical protein